jgi:DNA polymerase III epsilon subunit-like protein
MNRDLIILDFETGGKNPHTCQLTQIAAIALDGRSFKLKGSFNSEIFAETDDEKAIELGLEPVQEGALKITGKTREKISLAPDIKYVWPKFVDFVNKYNFNNTSFFAPIPCGYNIINYDMVIIDRLCKKFGQYKNNKQTLFSPIFKIDVLDIVYSWTESDPDIKSVSLDKMREITGLSSNNAHDALQDVKDTANIMILFLKTQREIYQKLLCNKMPGAFADGKLYVE